MNARSVRYAAVVTILPALLLVLGGCKAKPQAIPDTGAKAAPQELDVTLHASVARPASIASLEHDATAPRRPGDGVQVTARAVVPEGHRLSVELMGTGFKVPVSSGMAPDVYKGGATLPAIPPGTYTLRGTITGPGGQQVAQMDADTSITIIPKTTPCEEAQNSLNNLRVPFDYDKSDLNAKAKEVLTSVTDVLKRFKPAEFQLAVEGHCDQRGTVAYNLALSERRAGTVAGYLVDLGVVDRARVKKVPYGKEHPLVNEENEAAYAQNRRAEFKLTCSPN